MGILVGKKIFIGNWFGKGIRGLVVIFILFVLLRFIFMICYIVFYSKIVVLLNNSLVKCVLKFFE